MKRAGLLLVIAAIMFCLVAGAYSKQEEQAKRQKQEEMQMIKRELDRLSLRAHQMAEEIRVAAVILQQSP